MPTSSPTRAVVLCGVLLSLCACKNAKDVDTPTGTNPPAGAMIDTIPPSAAGAGGCNGANQSFAGCEEIDLALVLAALGPSVATLTRITAAQGADELLYATAVFSASGDATVVEIDLADPSAPVARTLLAVGAVDAFASSALGVTAQAAFGELAVLDASLLVVAELATNTIVAVGRAQPSAILPFAGAANGAGGFFDSTTALARFDLDPESQLRPTSDGRVFVADTGNNALRVILGNPLFDPTSLVLTLAGGGPTGLGGAGFVDGPLVSARFDAPTGLVLTCGNQMLVTERGDGGLGGHRVRRLTLFGFDPFAGALTGFTETEAGTGVAMSVAGVGAQALVAEPTGPQSSMDGEVYWIDASTGVLRRQSGFAGPVDCPLAPSGNCALASQFCDPGQVDFPAGASFSTAISGTGALYVLASGTTLLRRFGP